MESGELGARSTYPPERSRGVAFDLFFTQQKEGMR